MPHYVKYDTSTGQITANISCPANMIRLQLNANENYIETTGRVDDTAHDVDVRREVITSIPEDERAKPDYRMLRIKEYPRVEDQLDTIIKYFAGREDLTPELAELVDTIDKIKKKYPKE